MYHVHANPKAMSVSSLSFGRRLVLLRESHGLTRTGLASAIGVSKVTIWKWENDRSFPRPDKLQRLASTFGISASLLARPLEELSQPLKILPFGERLSALRKQRHLTLTNVGLAIGVSHVLLCYWEKGRGYPDQKKLRKLADVFQVSVSLLAHGEEGASSEFGDCRQRQLDMMVLKAKEMIADVAGISPAAVVIRF